MQSQNGSVIVVIDLKGKCSTRPVEIVGSSLDDAASKFTSNPMLEMYLKALGYIAPDSDSELGHSYSDLESMEEFNRTHFTPSGFFYAGHTCCQFSIRSVTHVNVDVEPTAQKGLIKRLIYRLICK